MIGRRKDEAINNGGEGCIGVAYTDSPHFAQESKWFEMEEPTDEGLWGDYQMWKPVKRFEAHCACNTISLRGFIDWENLDGNYERQLDADGKEVAIAGMPV